MTVISYSPLALGLLTGARTRPAGSGAFPLLAPKPLGGCLSVRTRCARGRAHTCRAGCLVAPHQTVPYRDPPTTKPPAGKYSLDDLPSGPRGALFRQLLPDIAPLLAALEAVAKARGKTVSQVRSEARGCGCLDTAQRACRSSLGPGAA